MKTNKFLAMLLAAATMTASLTACDDDDNNGDDPQTPTEETLTGRITESITLRSEITYTLDGQLLIEEGGSLTIPAGTVIEAKKGFSNYILVLQGGKIFVNGTASAPVTMTLSMEGATTADRWGGLVINGRAPLESTEADPSKSMTGETEISSAYAYGGDVPNDNSGSITYLKLLYTGEASSANVEHNGLTLNGVGNGTTINNLFIKDGSDDGIEFFGGTVDVTNILVVNSDDDMFDMTRGYSGTVTNAYGIWEAGFSSSESDPSGVEADGNLDGENTGSANQSDFTIENMTIDLRLAYDKAKFMQNALRIRRNCTATIENALVKGTGYVQNLINLDGGATGGADTDTAISITNSLTTAADTAIKPQSGTTIGDYPDVAIEEGNTGCPTNIFAWTGYAF